jgi:mannan endo-1,4-beta-mannosidase
MDYVTVNSIDAIDACSFHTYADPLRGHWGLTPEETERWIRGHIEDAHDQVGKPAYNGEWGYGVRRNGDRQQTSLETRNRLYQRYFEWYDEYDLDGSVVYHLSPGEIDPRRVYAIAYPQDQQTCALIEKYGSIAREKSGTRI